MTVSSALREFPVRRGWQAGSTTPSAASLVSNRHSADRRRPVQLDLPADRLGARREPVACAPPAAARPRAADRPRHVPGVRVLTALSGTKVPSARPVRSAPTPRSSAPVLPDGVRARGGAPDPQDTAGLTRRKPGSCQKAWPTCWPRSTAVDVDAVAWRTWAAHRVLRRQLDRWQRQWELSMTREVPATPSW